VWRRGGWRQDATGEMDPLQARNARLSSRARRIRSRELLPPTLWPAAGRTNVAWWRRHHVGDRDDPQKQVASVSAGCTSMGFGPLGVGRLATRRSVKARRVPRAMWTDAVLSSERSATQRVPRERYTAVCRVSIRRLVTFFTIMGCGVLRRHLPKGLAWPRAGQLPSRSEVVTHQFVIHVRTIESGRTASTAVTADCQVAELRHRTC